MKVTDEMAYKACKAGRLTRDEPSDRELALMRMKLEAVLGDLPEVRVPDMRIPDLLNPRVSPDPYSQGWNACREAMLSAPTPLRGE